MLHKISSEDLYVADQGWLVSRFHFSFAEYHDPKNMQFGRLRVVNDDLLQAGKILDLHPEEEQTSKILVDYLVQSGRLSEAMLRIEKALAAGTESAHLLSQKSYVLFASNDIKGAIEEMQKAVKLRPDHAGYYYNLALLYMKNDNPGRAEQYARKVEALEPEYPGLGPLLQEIQGGRAVSQKKR